MYSHHAPHPWIIDQEIWDKAQAIKAKYASQCGNKLQTCKSLLTGLVQCGCCDGSMTIIGKERYACSARREQNTDNNATSIKAHDLEQRVFDGLQSISLGREETMQAFSEAFHAEFNQRQINRSLKNIFWRWKLEPNAVLIFSRTQTPSWRAYAARLKN